MNKGKLGIGVVGAGWIAREAHLPAIMKIEGAQVVALSDVSQETASQVAKAFSIEKVFTDYNEMLKLDGIDIVDICTPNAPHHPVAMAALKAGKHVICEKPLAVTPGQVEEMIAESRKQKKKLMSIQNMRFTPGMKKLKEMIVKGDMGEIYFARAQALRRRNLPVSVTFIKKDVSGGGPLLDIGVHILDLTYWLMGFPEILSVTGMTATKLAKRKDIRGDWGEWDREMYDVEDFAAGFVKLSGGAVLTLEASFLLNMKEKETFNTSLFGTEAGIHIGRETEIYTEHEGVHLTTQITQVPETDSHCEQIRGFIGSVREGSPVPIPPEETLGVIRILDAMYQSSASGREVIFPKGR